MSAPKALPRGTVTLRWEFIYDGGKTPGAGGRGDMFINGEQVASGRIDRTIPFFTGTETADVGMDDLTPVTHDYKAYDNAFTGHIRKIVIGVAPVGEAFDPPLEWNGVGSLERRLPHREVPRTHAQCAKQADIFVVPAPRFARQSPAVPNFQKL